MTNDHKKVDFAAGLNELEEITAWFESEEVDLDAALPKFERGMELAASLRAHLKTVENKVEKIKQRFDTVEPPEPVGPAEPKESSAPELF
jgi:exodeoxyribonuclease VII small subunit